MKEILKSIYPYLFLFFVFVLPLDKYATAIPNIILITLLIIFPFVVSKKDFLKLKSKNIYIFGILIFYISTNSLLFQDYLNDITIIQKIISAFLLIVLYIPIENTDKLKKTIIIASHDQNIIKSAGIIIDLSSKPIPRIGLRKK